MVIPPPESWRFHAGWSLFRTQTTELARSRSLNKSFERVGQINELIGGAGAGFAGERQGQDLMYTFPVSVIILEKHGAV